MNTHDTCNLWFLLSVESVKNEGENTVLAQSMNKMIILGSSNVDWKFFRALQAKAVLDVSKLAVKYGFKRLFLKVLSVSST